MYKYYICKCYLKVFLTQGGIFMARNREISKQNKKKHKEEILNFKNEYNINDEVPFKAVLNIINKKQE